MTAHLSSRPERQPPRRAAWYLVFVLFLVNAVAYIAQKQGHHPDMQVGFNFCHIKFTTHAIDGLSQNDFICAARIDQLLA